MPRANVGEIHLDYEVHGAGTPLILIMGASGTSAWWGPLVPLLARAFRVVVFDNRGIGLSDGADAPYSTLTMAGDTAGLMDILGIDAAHILGFSMGGLVAQELALRWPQRVLSLILAGTGDGAGTISDEIRALSRQAASLPFAAVLPMMPAMLFSQEYIQDHPEAVEAFKAAALARPVSSAVRLRQLDAIEAHRTRDRLAAITAPTLVLGGEKDVLVPIEHQREFAARIAGAEFAVLAGCGHLFTTQAPDATSRVLLDFLARHPGSAARPS
mgnify:CR=1 FL=1